MELYLIHGVGQSLWECCSLVYMLFSVCIMFLYDLQVRVQKVTEVEAVDETCILAGSTDFRIISTDGR